MEAKRDVTERQSDFGPTEAEPDAATPAERARPAEAELASFVGAVWEHYRRNRRDLPWRRTRDPYQILVSEIMLQQTQAARVLEKYPLFLTLFPTVSALARAPVADVLAAWQGLGYNRRALALHRAAKTIVETYAGRVPDSVEELRNLPGVGPATAAAVSAFAFNHAEPFIETNIRSAFIHSFFPDDAAVPDSDILPLVRATLDGRNPRDWFYALMDYGVWVKKAHGNPGRRSKHHVVQSPYSGSRRELRAHIVRFLLPAPPAGAGIAAIQATLPAGRTEDRELASVLDELVREGFLTCEDGAYRVAGRE
jgi:A/G-specific adenine glycosylase